MIDIDDIIIAYVQPVIRREAVLRGVITLVDGCIIILNAWLRGLAVARHGVINGEEVGEVVAVGADQRREDGVIEAQGGGVVGQEYRRTLRHGSAQFTEAILIGL